MSIVKIVKNQQIHNLWTPLGPLGGPKTLFNGPGRPLIYQYYEIMCSNEFTYHWDRF